MGPFLVAMGQVPSIARCAERVGVDRSTVHRAMQRHEEFAVAVHEAREGALDTLEHVIYLRATAGTPTRKTVTETTSEGKTKTTVTEEQHVSDTLAMFYLRRWRPEYRDNYSIELTEKKAEPGRLAPQAEEKPLTREQAALLREILGPPPVDF